VEETGAAQHLRDSRIATIYEGTNGIQALDLVGRKLKMDGGKHWKALFAQMRAFVSAIKSDGSLPMLQDPLAQAVDALQTAAQTLFDNEDYSLDTAAGASQFMRMFGIILGGYLLAQQAHAAKTMLAKGEGNKPYLETKLNTARFYAAQILPQGPALLGPVLAGGEELFAVNEDQFTA
ncbi:MAG: acyl-CoA dehydrogenase, partial [Pseudomonadota bacterium]